MSEAHHRKKQPVVVRRQLLDEAAALAVEQGLTGLTLEAVARAAGVSKGGLLHHFPSKHALLEALCDEFLRRLEERIAQAMAQDEIETGRFARAYLDAMASRDWMAGNGQWAVLSVMLFSEPEWRRRWHDWVEGRLRQNGDIDASPATWIVRLAADGLWLSDLVEGRQSQPQRRKAVLEELRAMTTRPKDYPCLEPKAPAEGFQH
ncbi:TetR/AcrR family transcriptional regulator [Paracandidimonas soli]|uniref:TetR/AcrR family transcriptional regulator n=1 Tax=Paracandidimonas soli TaxID=1917182 RepID=UPI000B02454F